MTAGRIFGGRGARFRRYGIVFINLGSLLAQTVQIAGYPTLLALALARADYPSWEIGIVVSLQWIVVFFLAPFVPGVMKRIGIRATCQAGTLVSLAALALLLASQSTLAIARPILGADGRRPDRPMGRVRYLDCRDHP